MAKYQFNISNYHAIKHAGLVLEGLTVVAGCFLIFLFFEYLRKLDLTRN